MSQPAASERLQKVLADAGVASRRAAEALIEAGRVTVNGREVRTPGTRVRARRDRICVDGKRVAQPEPRRYFVVYKPRGVVSTTHDAHARRTVLDLVRSGARLFPVGRLDSASEGLLLLTNDGELAQRLLHPSFEVPRTYRASVEGRVEAAALRALASGVPVAGRRARAREVRLLEQSDARSVVELVVVEGRKHQIREMLQAVGHPVRRLLRVRFGPLTLQGLGPGESRPLRSAEREALLRMLAAPAPARQPGRAQPASQAQENPRKIK
jgi:23S rRNA pseudouridine2605 synthase